MTIAPAGETVIRGGRRWPTLAGLAEVVVYRRVLYALIRRNVATRYRQSVFGFLWILAGPLSSAGIYAVFLGHVAKVRGDEGTNYTVFVLVGTVIWGVFLRGGIGGMSALVTNSQFVKKVYFPRVLLPLATVGASLIDLVPALAVLFVVAAASGESPRASWAVILVPCLVVTVFTTAFAMATSAVNVYFRDLSYSAALLTQAGMLASAVVYPLSALPHGVRTAYAIVNPIAGAVDGARAVLYRGDGLNTTITLGGLAWSVALLLAAFVVFSILERDAADRI
jgi:lipopolysaccharide transport system permease protein